MRIGVYGGSFNPPHVGHGLVAAWLRWADRVDEVWLTPVRVHAFSKDLPPFDERVRWCEALAGCVGPWVRVCTAERELDPPNYTLHTLDALARRHPEHDFRLVVGADVLEQTPRWFRWPDIERRFPPVVVGRAGWPDVSGSPTFPAISSTAVRQALALGQDVSAVVPAAVLAVMGRTAAQGPSPITP